MTQSTIKFNSQTDKLEAITHIVNKLISEAGGDVLLQHARTQTLETLQNHGTNLNGFDGDEFDTLVADNDKFTTGTDAFAQDTLTNVRTVGPRPDWLSMPNTDNDDSADANVDIDGLGKTGSGTVDDFENIDYLTNHQPDALKEAGFTSYRDLYEADADELTAVPGVTNSDVDQIQAEASQLIDPVAEIARAAYEDEVKEHETGDEDDPVTDAHLVTDVKIPAGKPRDPEKYADTNETWHIFGLPVLENPTVSATTLENVSESAESLDEFVNHMSALIAYETQAEAFRDAVEDTFDDFSELETAVSEPRDETVLSDLLTQVGGTSDQLETAFEAHADMDITQNTPREIANEIDRMLDGEIPVQARLQLVDAVERELDANNDVTALQDDTTVADLTAATDGPIEIDHPFIEDVDDFPTLKTRELETGEQDIEAAARIIAKNNYALDLIGHAGVGKDTLIRVLAALTNRPTLVINMDESMISQDLMGIHKIDENGQVIFKDGVIPHCAKYGYLLCISEVNAAAPEILTAFHQLLERNSKLHVKERDEVITPSRKFRITTTRNPPTQEYDGAKQLNGAFKRRLNSFWLDYLDTPEEVDLVDSMVNGDRVVIDRDDINVLVNIANDFRGNADQSHEFPRISTSKVLHIIDMYDGADDLLGAAKESIKAHLGPRHKEEACMNAIEDHF